VRAGIDLVSVEAVRESLGTHGRHYLDRVYTEREVQDCTGPGGVDPERLAARFAAKEAALKVLRPGDVGLSLSEIELRRSPEGWVDLELSGPAAEIAVATGLSDFSVSITHEGGFASAVVIANVDLRKG